MDKFLKLSVFALALGFTSGAIETYAEDQTTDHSVSVFNNFIKDGNLTVFNKMNVDIPVVNTNNGQSKVQMSIVNGQAHLSLKIELAKPKPYLFVRFFTQEDGIYKSIPYSETGEYELTLTDEELAILEQQVNESKYAALGIDILDSNEQLPISMIYARDILAAYNELMNPQIATRGMSVSPFTVGKDSHIIGTFDNRGTKEKDTLMLIVNGLGRRIVQFTPVPEDQQTENQYFQLYAEDFVNTIDKKVSILHLKDGQVYAEAEVPLKSINN